MNYLILHFLWYDFFKSVMISKLLLISFNVSVQEAYNNIPIEPKVTFLLNSLHNGALSEEVIQMAAILVRRLFTSEFADFYPKVIKL